MSWRKSRRPPTGPMSWRMSRRPPTGPGSGRGDASPPHGCSHSGCGRCCQCLADVGSLGWQTGGGQKGRVGLGVAEWEVGWGRKKKREEACAAAAMVGKAWRQWRRGLGGAPREGWGRHRPRRRRPRPPSPSSHVEGEARFLARVLAVRATTAHLRVEATAAPGGKAPRSVDSLSPTGAGGRLPRGRRRVALEEGS
ncbi:hypothetical protein PR202_ga25265 [Eleusine coracana subsp. coracana]|uniref:Uncharacterized protein n=1 Tax=Eleusine coracana subsp. coracana TaxID=191504 RepID=A0AAV5DB86_ELECO|nr:hypothetical protein PR202_ga25265 [Eleusine coracana subsp. coracana]